MRNPGIATEPAQPTSNGAPLVTITDVGKSFGGVVALKAVSLGIERGRVLAIMGENGAGKTTLMKILCGVIPHGEYDGEVTLDGMPCAFPDVHAAREAGIVLIPQELHVAPELSIAENMFSGTLPAKRGRVDWTELRRRADDALREFGLHASPFSLAKYMSPSEQRLALIAAALAREARILVLDEPTASLSDGEAAILFGHLERLRDQGIAIVLISHRLDDIARIADEVAVLRNGELVAHHNDGIPERSVLVTEMIGRKLEVSRHRREVDRTGMPRLRVEGLSAYDPRDPNRRRVADVSLSVASGEVLCVFGLVGAGRTELAHVIFGLWPGRVEGRMALDGEPFAPGDACESIEHGLAYLGEDRQAVGIFSGHAVQSNLTAAALDKVTRHGFMDRRKERVLTSSSLERFDIRPRGSRLKVEHLSGGNQQKVLVARWVATDPHVLLLDEPTTGVDVGARQEIYTQIVSLADEGRAVLVISSDLDEVLTISDRIIVMYKGRITAEFEGDPSRHELMAAATGGRV